MDQTEGRASLMESGVDIYLRVIVCFKSLFKGGNKTASLFYNGACSLRSDSVGE